MSLYTQFKTDKNLENEGVYLDYGMNSQDKPIRIRIARAGGANQAFARAYEQKTKPYRRQIQTDTLDPKVAERIILEVYAETVVLGWEGVEDENGDELPFNRDNCVKLFTDLPDLFADLQKTSQNIAVFRAEVREADAKN